VPWLDFGDHDEEDAEILPPVVYNRDTPVRTHLSSREESLERYLYHPLKHIDVSDMNERDRQNPFFIVCGMYKSTLASWVQVLNMIENDNNRLQEVTTESMGEAAEQLRGHISFLERVAITLHEYHEAVTQQSSTKYATVSAGNALESRVTMLESLQHDITYLMERCNSLQKRCDNTSKLLARFTDVRNAEENMKQTRQVAFLTVLASFVLPWSVIATIFGMNVNEITKDGNMPTIVYPVALAGATGIVGSLFIWRERLMETCKSVFKSLC
jgi:Mg2+ and Co2+ transporter CorA